MFKLFQTGGPLFMGILTLLFVAMLAVVVFQFFLIQKKEFKQIGELRNKLRYIKTLGTLGLVFGFLGQMVGLYEAFTVISEVGEVSPGLLAGGLKVSMITSIYGLLILIISYLLWLLLDYLASREINGHA